MANNNTARSITPSELPTIDPTTFNIDQNDHLEDDGLSPPEKPLEKIKLWHRVHVRLGGVVLALLLTMILAIAYGFYIIAYNNDLNFLQQRLLGVITTLSQTVEADIVATFESKTIGSEGESTQGSPYHQQLEALFKYVAEIDPDISTVYILLPTDTPGILQFYYDYATDGEHAAIGEIYDATDLPILLKGFTAPTVEPEAYEDIYGLSLSAYAPLINSAGETIGIVGADVEIEQLNVLKKRILELTLFSVAIATLIVTTVAFIVGRSLSKPFEKLLTGVHNVSEGDLNTSIALKRPDEFGVLANCFNTMVDDLKDREQLRETFGRYMSKKIAHALLTKGDTPDLGGETCMVTIIFSDLKDYSRITQSMGAQQLIGTLNTYFGAMNEIIDTHGGCVIEFLGDAVLAVFGAPYKRESHACDAVLAARYMQERLDRLNEAWERDGTAYLWQECGVEKLSMRIGIHTGYVVAGNMGSLSRMKYAVIGDTVNIAARLETLNNSLDTNILLSDAVKKELTPNLKKLLRCCGEHSIKGHDKPIQVYTMDGADSATT